MAMVTTTLFATQITTADVRAMLREDALPRVLRLGQRKPGIDRRPARPVLDQPQIDMVEREGQPHAQPLDAGGDRVDLARRGRGLCRKMQQF